MSGTLSGPAPSLAAGGVGATLPRLWAPIAVAVALHAAVLAVRPGGLTGRHVAPAAKAMAVRMVPPSVSAEPALGGAERTTEAAPTAPEAALAAPPPERSAAPTAAARARRARETALQPTPTSPGRGEPETASDATSPAPAMPSTADAALPAAPDYAFGVRLDPGPRPLDDIEPEYPDPHLREGTVVLRLLISEAGRVDNVAVVRSDPRGVFEQAALDAFGKARFAPGLAAGTPVKSQITVEVRFVPINRGARVSGRTY